ncbi:MAG: chemotaxis protein CheB, partial [Chloroflexota bacterium]
MADSLTSQNINTDTFVNKEVTSEPSQPDGYIVGIGASAGGLDAIERFFSNVSAESGHAYVVVQHLSPDYKSLMAELLDKSAKIPIQEAEHDQPIEFNHAYLIPSGKVMTIEDGRIKLSPRPLEQGVVLPIDIFLESLAKDRPGRSIGIILSGNGRDGTNGMRVIHQSGGFLLAQNLSNAQFEGMPKSVINTGLVHFAGNPEEMPAAIERLILRKAVSPVIANQEVGDKVDDRPISIDKAERIAVNEIYRMLQNHRGIDFAFYKQNTLWRRIEARMGFLQIDQASDYADLVSQSDEELDILFYNLLIGVTQFFRDGDAFELLKEHVVKPLVRNSAPGEPIRVWIPGCS